MCCPHCVCHEYIRTSPLSWPRHCLFYFLPLLLYIEQKSISNRWRVLLCAFWSHWPLQWKPAIQHTHVSMFSLVSWVGDATTDDTIRTFLAFTLMLLQSCSMIAPTGIHLIFYTLSNFGLKILNWNCFWTARDNIKQHQTSNTYRLQPNAEHIWFHFGNKFAEHKGDRMPMSVLFLLYSMQLNAGQVICILHSPKISSKHWWHTIYGKHQIGRTFWNFQMWLELQPNSYVGHCITIYSAQVFGTKQIRQINFELQRNESNEK